MEPLGHATVIANRATNVEGSDESLGLDFVVRPFPLGTGKNANTRLLVGNVAEHGPLMMHVANSPWFVAYALPLVGFSIEPTRAIAASYAVPYTTTPGLHIMAVAMSITRGTNECKSVKEFIRIAELDVEFPLPRLSLLDRIKRQPVEKELAGDDVPAPSRGQFEPKGRSLEEKGSVLQLFGHIGSVLGTKREDTMHDMDTFFRRNAW